MTVRALIQRLEKEDGDTLVLRYDQIGMDCWEVGNANIYVSEVRKVSALRYDSVRRHDPRGKYYKAVIL